MNETRLVTAKEELFTALVELDKDEPNIPRVLALLDDARGGVVDVVEELIGCRQKADQRQLDEARQLINRAVEILSGGPGEWGIVSCQHLVGDSIDLLNVVLSGNVVALRRNTTTTPDGAA